MIPTYTVIIQNKKTTHEFNRYLPLFSKALSENKIGLCKWIESGTTLETALPGISNMTNDKEDWRAVVVRYEDERHMADYPCDSRNPYDFEIYSKDNPLHECEVPLVRLTHILAGVPKPATEFEPVLIREENKAPHTVYRPVENKEETDAFKKLTAKYEYDGKKPKSVILITVREKPNQESIDAAWTAHRESESSEFWKRNHYPSHTRFLVYDFDRQGPTKRTADEFRFWTTLLLLSTNTIDSSVLQAYKLYRIKPEFDTKKLSDCFQETVHLLRRSKNKIEEDIKRDLSGNLLQSAEYPHYKLDVPVGVTLPRSSERGISKHSFSLFSDGIISELSEWSMKRKALEKTLDECVRMADRELDNTAEKTRAVCFYDESEVSELNRYQTEDLQKESFELTGEIIDTQSRLPSGNVANSEEIISASDKVCDHLQSRTSAGPVCAVLGIAAALSVLSQFPQLMFLMRGQSEIPLTKILLSALGIFALSAAFGFIALYFQKLRLNKSIKNYNDLIGAAFNRITENASDYSTYLSAVASDCRANSYLTIAHRLKFRQSNSHYSKYRLIKSIDLMISKVKTWSRAFYLNPDFEMALFDLRESRDINMLMIEQSLNSSAIEKGYDVEINRSGVFINTPYDFVTRLQIEREELYDD